MYVHTHGTTYRMSDHIVSFWTKFRRELSSGETKLKLNNLILWYNELYCFILWKSKITSFFSSVHLKSTFPFMLRHSELWIHLILFSFSFKSKIPQITNTFFLSHVYTNCLFIHWQTIQVSIAIPKLVELKV